MEQENIREEFPDEEAVIMPEEEADEPEGEDLHRGMRLLRPGDGLAVAFFVPVAVMVIIFAQRGIFPFGEESFLRMDMYHQYAPFFSEFRNKLVSGESLLYSWDIGMGVNFSALYAYYLASPFNWLLVLCPKQNIIEFMSYGMILKTGLAGLSFAWYLAKREKKGEMSDFGAGFFGIFYALSGYMAAYSWNVMWLDCIVLFPLVLLGLERLVRQGRPKLYCVCLGASILSNYYISIMICMFMVIYMVSLLILYPPKGVGGVFQTIARFTFFSLIAGGLAALVILPAAFALKSTASGDFDFPKTLTSYFSIFDMIARHMANVEPEIGLDHWPNIYCGTAVLLFFPLYLASKKISLREKAVYCTLLLLFFASFSTNALNFIWHGFHYPNSLPCRQSFIYISLMLTVCYQAYVNFEEIPIKHTALAFLGAASFVILAEKLVDNKEQFHFSVYYIALILLALYAGLSYLYVKKNLAADIVLLAALGIVSLEGAVNMAVTSIPITSRTAYTNDNQDVIALTQRIPQDNTFYRVEKMKRKTKNDGAWMNFPSVSLFSSTADAGLSDFFKKLGCESSTNAYSITGSTPLVNSLFSVRYGIYDQEHGTGELLAFADKEGDSWLYENLYTLPVAFMLPDDLEYNWNLDSGNPCTVQNDISSVLDLEPVLIRQETITQGENVSFTAQEPGDYYVFVTSRKAKEVSAVVGTETLDFDNVDRGYLLELGSLAAGEKVSMEAKDDKVSLQAEAYRFSPKGFRQVYDRLSQNPMTVTKRGDRSLAGSIVVEKTGTLFTSIPFDKGWTVKVDGQKVAAREVFDTFLGIDIGAGSHVVEMSYEPPGLRMGAWISAVSILAITAATWMEQFFMEKRRKDNL